MEHFATHKDNPVHCLTYKDSKGTEFCKARKRVRNKFDICPFCHKEIKDGTVSLFFSNWKLFPNVVTHFSCHNGFPTKEAAIKYLHEDYQKAMEHKHWFNGE